MWFLYRRNDAGSKPPLDIESCLVARLPLIVLLVLAAELASILLVGQFVGFWVTLALLMLTPIAGMHFIRQSGFSFAEAAQAASQSRALPAGAARKGVFQFAAGVLFMVPGFATDVLALLLLLPPVQAATAKYVMSFFSVTTTTWPKPPSQGPVIEGEAVEIIPPEKQLTDKRDSF